MLLDIAHAPFPPELQLLAVLPPRSAALLPEALRPLVSSASSPVVEFYPQTFEEDLKEGDREWQATILLPFVDEVRLRSAVAEKAWQAESHFKPARAFLADLSSVGLHASARSWDFAPHAVLSQERPPSEAAAVALEAAAAKAAARLAAEPLDENGREREKNRRNRKGKGKGKGTSDAIKDDVGSATKNLAAEGDSSVITSSGTQAPASSVVRSGEETESSTLQDAPDSVLSEFKLPLTSAARPYVDVVDTDRRNCRCCIS